MKKTILSYLIIFSVTFFIYFAVGTKFTFQPKWQLDYFNLMAKSLQEGRLDIVNSGTTYDLVLYKDKWYVPWGPLPAILLIPPQVVLGRFIPAFYLSIFFASLNTAILYALLRRISRELFPISTAATLLFTALYAFGTTQFYVGTLGGPWHVDQMVSSFLATLGIFVVFKKKRRTYDYVFSAILFSASLLGRPTISMLMVLPFFLYVWEYFFEKKKQDKKKALFKMLLIFGIPGVLFSLLFFLYNYVRFEHGLEYGYSYIRESAYLEGIREKSGTLSLSYIPYNLWYMLFEIPRISLVDRQFVFNFNLLGNSIFFLTLPFLAAFLAPLRNRYVLSLWLSAIITMLPSLMIYSTGWVQFGYRYSLDITVLLIILAVFGMKGRVNLLFILGVILSIVLYLWGIFTLM